MENEEKSQISGEILLELEEFFDKDDNINSIEVRFDDPKAELKIVIRASRPDLLDLELFDQFSRGFPVEIVKGERESVHRGLPSDDPLKLAAERRGPRSGQGGSQLIHTDGSWGTLTLSLEGMTIELSQGGVVQQRCHRSGPTLISNAHVMEPVGTTLTNYGDVVGRTSCQFDLNRVFTVDYAHADWTNFIEPGNYARVLDPSNVAGRRVVAFAPASAGMPVSIQGARSGWQQGAVVARAITGLTGYSGRIKCWIGNYTNNFGDSGSAVITRNGANWTWVGVHFAANGHFWSWDNLSFRADESINVIPVLP